MKRLILVVLILFLFATEGFAEESRITPSHDVPDYVQWLLTVADEEVGYQEAKGWTKYGEWSGDGYAEWCAEFLCWCVDQVDERHGTSLLRNVYPKYSGTNTGRDWFIRHGRYVVRNGYLDDYGYQWLKGSDHYLRVGEYIPQPGDWAFFTWTSNTDTDHVAMVEYCTQDEQGNVTIHVIEGNNPSSVQRNTYELKNSKILGYGTVHDEVDWTLKSGYSGEKVAGFQRLLILIGLLPEGADDGRYGPDTIEAVKSFQQSNHLPPNGIANIATQRAVDRAAAKVIKEDPSIWLVQDEDEGTIDLEGILSDFPLKMPE